MNTERLERQRALVPPERLSATAVTVIGVGAIGRQVALQLAAIGVPRLQLIDFDRVEFTNVTSQGYLWEDAQLQRPKVVATRQMIRRMDPHIETETVEDRYRPDHAVHDVVYCCVDSISARAAIWRGEQRRARFFADGRMLGENLRVFAVADGPGRAAYSHSFFPQAEAQSGSCTSRSTIYAAAIAAALMVHQLTRWLRELPLDTETSLNLLAGEWLVASPSMQAEAAPARATAG
jgi:sulfur carrier protein ThiS adenylyltransferase